MGGRGALGADDRTRGRACPPALPGGRPRLPPVRRALRPARRAARAPRATKGSPARCTTPFRSTAPAPTPSSASEPGSLPVSEAAAERICSLPVFPGMSDAELDQVVGAVARFTKDVPAGAFAHRTKDATAASHVHHIDERRSAPQPRAAAAPWSCPTTPSVRHARDAAGAESPVGAPRRSPTACGARSTSLVASALLLVLAPLMALIALGDPDRLARAGALSPAPRRARSAGVHDLQVPHDAQRRRHRPASRATSRA